MLDTESIKNSKLHNFSNDEIAASANDGESQMSQHIIITNQYKNE